MEKVIKAAEEVKRLNDHQVGFIAHMKMHGFPTAFGTTSIAPYDLIGDYFRGATGMMTDLYRNKDKLLQLLDKAVVFILRQTIAAAKQWNHPIVFIPTHWAPDAFMSPKQFETFWWPTFRKLLIGLIDAGLIPMPLWESDCTKRLETIRDIPAGKCIYWFERTDMVKAFEVLGDVVALERKSFALAAHHRETGRSGRRGPPPGGQCLSQGRQADPRCRLRHTGRNAGRERARHVRGGAQIRQLTERAQRHADGPRQQALFEN